MVLTRDEIEARLKPIEDFMFKAMGDKDIDSIMSLYHRDVAVTLVGSGQYFGYDAIRREVESSLQLPLEYTFTPTYASASDDAEYLIRRGYWTLKGDPRTYNYETVFRLCEGRYLIAYGKYNDLNANIYTTCTIM